MRVLAILSCFLITTRGDPAAHASGLDCRQLSMLFQVNLQLHYTTHELTDDVKTAAVEQYLKSIDPAKTLLLESDVATLRPVLRSFIDTLPSGHCAELNPATHLKLRQFVVA